MATIGQQLIIPETGWYRTDDTNPNLTYSAMSSESIPGETYNNGDRYSNTQGAYVCFNFIGSALRIIGCINNDHSRNISIVIDGKEYTYSEVGATLIRQAFVFEKTGLAHGEHSVKIINNVSGYYFTFDAVDIDSTESIKNYNPSVAWIYKTKSNTSSMQIGDRISFEYTAPTAGQVGTFANLGSATKTEIPAASSATPDGKAYFIFAGYDSEGKTKLVCDRNLQHSISWDTINAAGLVNGVEVQIGSKKGIMRLMTGGISASDTDNEWDRIVCQSTLNGTVTAGDNTVWNWQSCYTITSTTIDGTSTARVQRGLAGSTPTYYASNSSGYAGANLGFRPIILLDAQLNNLNSKSVEPYHVYPQQHESFIVRLNVANIESGAAANFRLLKNGEEVSAAAGATERTLQVSMLSDGLNSLVIETSDPVEQVGTISVYKESPYRSVAERTFLTEEEGYTARNTTKKGKAAIRTSSTIVSIKNGDHYEIPLNQETKTAKV